MPKSVSRVLASPLWRVVISALFVGTALAAVAATVVPAIQGRAAAGTTPSVTVPVHTGRAVMPKHVQLKWSSSPVKPSAQELKQEQAATAAMEHSHTPKGVMAPASTTAHVAVSGPAVHPATFGTFAPKSGAGPNAESDFTAYLTDTLAPSGAGISANAEADPSVGQLGKDIYASGNNYLAKSTNGGSTWSYSSPAATFGSDYCCEQRVVFEPTRAMLLYAAQIYNRSDPSASGIDFLVQSPSCSTGYEVNYATFGLPTNEILKFPDISVGLDDFYLTFQAWTPSFANYTGTVIVSFDLDTLAACGTVTPSFFGDASTFKFAMAGGGHGMYFGSNDYISESGCTLSTCNNGTQMRIYEWTEGASTITYSDHTIATFPWLFQEFGNCGSQDGVVANWCSMVDSTISTAYYSRAAYRGYGPGVLGFAWTQAPITGDTFPSVYRVYFALPSLAFKSSDLVYSPDYAIVAPSFATNVFGFIGGVMSFGGGTGTGTSASDFYPGSLFLLEDTDSPTQPWSTVIAKGTGDSPEPYWSVSNSIRADLPAGDVYIATSTTAGTGGVTSPIVVIFGRERYANSYARWFDS